MSLPFFSIDLIDSSSVGALECSGNITKKAAAAASARKLIGVHHRRHAAFSNDDEEAGPVCPVRFDHTRGISAVWGSCRDRPVVSPERCCGAFKTFACPYSDLINDAANGCANDMFFQIIVRGRLRPGLFSQMCVEGPLGLQC